MGGGQRGDDRCAQPLSTSSATSPGTTKGWNLVIYCGNLRRWSHQRLSVSMAKILSLWRAGQQPQHSVDNAVSDSKLSVAEFLTAMHHWEEPWRESTLLPQTDLATRRGREGVKPPIQQTLADALMKPATAALCHSRAFVLSSPNPSISKYGETAANRGTLP